MAVEVFIHKMSEHMEFGTLVRWLVAEGERVERRQVIMEVETDKVVAELEAPASGILKGIRSGAVEGAQIPVGEVIAFIAEPDEAVPTLPPFGPAPVIPSAAPVIPSAAPVIPSAAPVIPSAAPVIPSATPVIPSANGCTHPRNLSPPAAPGVPAPAEVEAGPLRATPVARRIARELGVDLARVKGSGPGGRIREEDVRTWASSHTPPTGVGGLPEVGASEAPTAGGGAVTAAPGAWAGSHTPPTGVGGLPGGSEAPTATSEAPTAGGGAVTAAPGVRFLASLGMTVELTSIQRVTGQRMLESVQSAPQFSLTSDADVTNLLWLREALMDRILAETGERLSITALLVRIVGTALRHHPRANASFEDGRVRLHPQINVGVAVGTDDGLLVPVIKEADQKSLVQIAQELKTFQDKARPDVLIRHMRFSLEDLAGGTFTLSNLGMYGVDRFNAIVNPPQSAILAVGRVIKTPIGLPDDVVALRPIMSLTLTVDHRTLDGVQGARFLGEVKERIEKPYGE